MRQSHKTILIWVILILMFVSIYSMFTDSGSKEKELDVTAFKGQLMKLEHERTEVAKENDDVRAVGKLVKARGCTPVEAARRREPAAEPPGTAASQPQIDPCSDKDIGLALGLEETAVKDFRSQLAAGRTDRLLPVSQDIEKVEVEPRNRGDAKYVISYKNSGTKQAVYAEYPDNLTKMLSDAGIPYKVKAKDDSSIWPQILLSWLPMLVLFGIFFLFMRQLQAGGGKAMSFGKSKAKLLTDSQNRITFKDVAGVEEAKDEVEEIIAFLKDPKKFTRLGGRIPKGVLMMGPPGTGKTLLARAIAGEAGVPFFSISGSDFVEMFVGVGASRVRDLFEQGKKNAPCLTGDAVVTLADGRTVTIEEMFERAIVDVEVPAMRDDFGVGTARVLGVTRKRSSDVRRVRTMHGEIRATGNHLFPVLRDGRVAWTRADALASGDYVAMPRRLATGGTLPRPVDFLPADARVYLDRLADEPRGRQFVRLGDLEPGDELQARRVAHGSGGWTDAALPRVPESTTERLMYLVGLIDSDGSWKSDRSIPFVNTCATLHEAVATIVEEAFGTVVRRSLMRRAANDDRPDIEVSYVHGRLIKVVLAGLRDRMLEMPVPFIAAWLRGMFDGDGCVQRDKLVISAWDPGANRRVRAALHRVGIVPFDAGKPGNIEITGKDDVARFMELVGSGHPDKRGALAAVSLGGRTASRADGIPVGRLLRDAREACGMGQRDFIRGNYVSTYERGEVVPPRSRVAALVDEMERSCTARGVAVPQAVDVLRRLADGDTRFTRVESVEHVPGEVYVYDLCLDDPHNFVANGLFVHNCIIFIDEIDAVGRHRGAGLGGGHDEREQTLNQLLVEMDGFESNDGVIIIAATNRPDVLDPALLRPGRFDRRIVVPRPDLRGRFGILQVHTRKVPLAASVDLEVIARGTPGFSGADLESLVNEAALIAARLDKDKVEMPDFEEAKDKVMMGTERRSMIISDKEKRTTAVHEAGHALVARFAGAETDPVHKVTIIPRGRALGLTQQLPVEDRLSMTREFAQNQIAILMGGRVAEEIVFNQKTTGAGNDIERATEIARAMVTEWGMSDEFGPLNFAGSKQEVFLGRDFTSAERQSEDTSKRIDAEIRRIVMDQYERATRILKEHRAELESVSGALLEYETIDGADIDRILRGEKLDRPLPTSTKKKAEAEEEGKGKRPALIPPIGKKDPSPEPA